jgi:hypothetical protein
MMSNRSIPLKDHHFGSIPLLSHLHVGPHESITCGVHDIYLKFGSFNGIDPIVPKTYVGRDEQNYYQPRRAREGATMGEERQDATWRLRSDGWALVSSSTRAYSSRRCWEPGV